MNATTNLEPPSRSPRKPLSPYLVRYGSALLSVGVATLARLFLTPFVGPYAVPFITYFPAVVFSAWIGGLGPGILTIVLGATVAASLFMAPSSAFALSHPAELWSLGTFIVAGLGIAAMGEAQRKAQDRAQTSQKLLSTTIRSIGDAVIATDKEGRLTFMNPVAEKMTGWSQAEALGKALEEVFVIVNERTRQSVESPVTKVLREGIVVGLANHTILIGREGTERPIDDSGAPIRDENGNLVGVILVFHDVTERRRYEQEQRAVMSSARCLLWYADVWDSGRHDLHWIVTPVNEEAAQNLLPLEIAPGKTYAIAWSESRLPEDKYEMDEYANRVVRENQSYSQEFRCRNVHGEIQWLRQDVTIETVAPKRWRAVGVTTDITERKRLEGERDYLMSSAECLLWWADVENTEHPLYLHWEMHFPDNEAAQRFLPLALEAGEAYRDAFYRCRLPEDQAHCDLLGTASVRAGQSYQQEFRCQCADGSVRWLQESIHVETILAGQQWRAVGVCTDITQRKQAEEALRDSETLYRTLGEAVPDFVWSCGADGQQRFVNQRWIDYTGLTEDSPAIPGNVLHHPEDFPRLVEIWKVAHARREPFEAEFRFRRHDGVYRWFMTRAVPVKDAEGNITEWVGTTTDIHERKQTEDALREAHAFRERVIDSAVFGVGALDMEGRFTLVNRRMAEIFGYPAEEVLGQPFSLVLPEEDVPHVTELFHQTVQHGAIAYNAETRIRKKSGEEAHVVFGWSPIRAEGKIVGLVGTAEDTTEKKRLENQLLEAQKLESVGRLAGGVAHDFNNMLTAIIGYAELIEEECPLDNQAQEYLKNVTLAAEKASNLTQQLLAFARRQVIEPKTLNLNDLILSLDKLLRRLIGENIELVILPEENLHAVKVDPGQFEQILVNLIVNARDAMPHGGKITIETDNVTLDAEYARHHEGTIPGDYVMLAVSDTGVGMEEGIRLHIFEPFFTTKAKGRGTGLGLATVYGIVRQAGGHIWLYSEPGEGTTFKIYLPRTMDPPEAVAVPLSIPRQQGGSETILLVEDEPAVRALAVQTLRARGYQVWEAANGEEALRIARGREQEIVLLITDVIMPQMSGKELADHLQALYPNLKILYASGYTENTIVHHGVLDAGIAFLSKPFTPSLLAQRVREILDNP
jgi:two-component system, cell cycle sensor histidine kinase and response regulator CckA